MSENHAEKPENNTYQMSANAVMFLEKEDPKRPFRQKVVSVVNVASFEEFFGKNISPAIQKQAEVILRKYWAEVVEMVFQTLTENGLNPRLIRNNKNSYRLMLKQDEIPPEADCPDEYFSINVGYLSAIELDRKKLEYVRKIDQYKMDLIEEKRSLGGRFLSWRISSKDIAKTRNHIANIEKEFEFYQATTPDPREMEPGLVFRMEVFTLKDYQILRTKLNAVVATFIDRVTEITYRYNLTYSSISVAESHTSTGVIPESGFIGNTGFLPGSTGASKETAPAASEIGNNSDDKPQLSLVTLEDKTDDIDTSAVNSEKEEESTTDIKEVA